MELSEVWVTYAAERLGSAAAAAAPIGLRASDTLGLLFSLHPMFTARWPAITATAYANTFEEDADGALCEIALYDSFASWDRLEAGVWRILAERLLYSETVLTLECMRDNRLIDSLPEGLSQDQQRKALFLKYALGHGRTIDRKLLQLNSDGSLASFPAEQTLRPQ